MHDGLSHGLESQVYAEHLITGGRGLLAVCSLEDETLELEHSSCLRGTTFKLKLYS